MQININILVDVVAALSSGSLQNCIAIMDDSRFDSIGQGTATLTTHCIAGQMVNWTLYAVDLQTPASLKEIRFLQPGAECDELAMAAIPVSDAASDVVSDVASDVVSDETCQSGEQIAAGDPDAKVWSGIVPYYLQPGLAYPYRLTLQMGDGKNSIMHIDSAALLRV